MSFQIDQAFVQMYRDNVIHLSQQKGSRLEGTVRRQPDIVGMNYYFERIGATAAQQKTGRHTPTPLISTPHSRRRVSMMTYNWGDLVDNDDKLKVLIQPESEYVVAATNAFGRLKDDIIIAGAYGPAASGSDGQTSVAFPAAQIISDAALNNDLSIQSGTTDSGRMSPQRLRAIKLLFDKADVDPDEERYALVTPFQIAAMLTNVQVTSADYNTVKALVEGAVDTYMGFKFILSNRLPIVGSVTFGISYPANVPAGVNTGDSLGLFWARSGIGLAVQEDVKTEMAKRADLNFATQLYMEMVMGAVRIEEAKVIQAAVKEV
jgi:hypothetical protein